MNEMKPILGFKSESKKKRPLMTTWGVAGWIELPPSVCIQSENTNHGSTQKRNEPKRSKSRCVQAVKSVKINLKGSQDHK